MQAATFVLTQTDTPTNEGKNPMYVCMYVCIKAFVARRSYSLSSHECAPVGQTEKMRL